jgi:hypothetical protein
MWVLIFFIGPACSSRKSHQDCIRSKIVNNAFQLEALAGEQFGFRLTDSSVVEYVNGKKIFERRTVWLSCDSYLLTTLISSNSILPEDFPKYTLVSDLRFKGDTLYLKTFSVYNGKPKTFEFKAYK